MLPHKVISGGQTGADIGGVIAAAFHGIPTGGWMPKDWITQTIKRPEYAKMFGMQEHKGGYKDRTWANVEASDGTLRVACDLGTPGELCTLKAIRNFDKPHFDVAINTKNPFICRAHLVDIIGWITDNNIQILNVAGNSHKTWPGMQSYTTTLLGYIFIWLGHSRIQVNPKYHFTAHSYENTSL